MRNFTKRVYFQFLLVVLITERATGQSLEDVKNLTKVLFTDYDIQQRPVLDQSNPVYLNLSLDILTIQEVNEVAGEFSIVALMTYIWQDQSLIWDPKDHNYVYTLVLPVSSVWYPKLALVNPSAKVDKPVEDWTSVRVYQWGWMVMIPVSLFQSTCPIDVTYYPFDTQRCNLMFSPLSYSGEELTLLSSSTSVLKNYYQEHGEWEIEESNAFTYNIAGGDNIMFSFKLKRKPRFVVVNVILPIVFMAVINILVFVIPPDSGERIGFSVTMLLALAVFLTLVGDNLPKTSQPMPILSNYLIGVLVLSISMCILVIINLRFHYKDENTVPPKLCKMFTRFVLCRMCRRRTTTNSDNVSLTKVHPFNKGVMKTKPSDFDDTETEVNDKNVQNITWKDFSFAIDIICLFVAISGTVAVNGYFMYVLSKGNQEADKE